MAGKVYNVYSICYPNGKPFYIGKGKEARLEQTLKRSEYNPLKQNIMNKIKRNGKNPIVKVLYKGLTEIQAFKIESGFIKKYGRRNNNTGILANMTDGGEGKSGVIVSEETREKRSKIFKGRKKSEEHKKNISKAKIGHKTTLKTRKKIAEAKTGSKHTDEAKINMSKAQKALNKINSQETKDKISKANSGKKRTAKQNKAQSER